MMDRGPDRRAGTPRRETDRFLHYAEQNLLAAALMMVDSDGIVGGCETRLWDAAASYRFALARAEESRRNP